MGQQDDLFGRRRVDDFSLDPIKPHYPLDFELSDPASSLDPLWRQGKSRVGVDGTSYKPDPIALSRFDFNLPSSRIKDEQPLVPVPKIDLNPPAPVLDLEERKPRGCTGETYTFVVHDTPGNIGVACQVQRALEEIEKRTGIKHHVYIPPVFGYDPGGEAKRQNAIDLVNMLLWETDKFCKKPWES